MSDHWENSMSVGVAELDERNRMIFEIFGKLVSACETGTAPDDLEEPLQGLVDFTKYHFVQEEELLEKHSYPEMAEHRAEHQKLIEDIEWLQTRFKEDKNHDLRSKTLKFLGTWLSDHIGKTDHHFRPFLNGQGVF